jgi:transposase
MVAWSQPPFSWSYRQIALVAGCSIGTVYNVLQLHREYGQVTNPLAEPTHKRHIVMDEADYKFVRGLVTAQPTLYLDEIQDRLFESRGTTASLASISRALKKLTITHKQVSKIAMERNELLQATWQGEIAQFLDNPSMFLFVDESAMNMHTALRRCGWSEAGSPCTQRQIFIRGQGFSVLPALSLDGVIALDIFQGAVNRERFIQFLRDHIVSSFILCGNTKTDCQRKVPLLNPFPQKHSIVVMDNCAIHHDAEIREIIENECGMCTVITTNQIS